MLVCATQRIDVVVHCSFLLLSCRHEYSWMSFIQQHAVAAFCYMVYLKRRLSVCNNQLATMKSIRKRDLECKRGVWENERGMPWKNDRILCPFLLLGKAIRKRHLEQMILDWAKNEMIKCCNLQWLKRRTIWIFNEFSCPYQENTLKMLMIDQFELACIFFVRNLKTS